MAFFTGVLTVLGVVASLTTCWHPVGIFQPMEDTLANSNYVGGYRDHVIVQAYTRKHELVRYSFRKWYRECEDRSNMLTFSYSLVAALEAEV